MTDLSERLQIALAGRYTIERELGRGGMGLVFLARDLRHDRPVALKIIRPELAATVGTERFLREIKVAARLQHPNILTLYDSGDADGVLYYAMPYVAGESLRQRLVREGQLSISESLSIAAQVASALSCAHSHDVVHRDIKPENILLADAQAMVADFGIARALDAAGERLTESGLALGTPSYMSPEQAAANTRLDGRSDVYSLGCVLYEMLAGEPPFTATAPQGVIAKHLHAPIPDLRIVRPAVSQSLQEVLATALAKVPADRFSSAAAFGHALETRGSSSNHRWRRSRVLLGSGMTIAVVAAIIAWGMIGVPIKREPRASSEALAAPRIAVLYLEDRTQDSSLGRIADGLTEELIHELSGVNAFRVVSRNGVRAYRGRPVSLDSIAAALRVTTVVDGTVQRTGDRLRVRVQLIDAPSDTYFDSLSLERPIAEFVTQERQVAQQIAAALRRQMGRAARLRGAVVGTPSEPARDLVLKAQRARNDADVLAEHPHPDDVRTATEALARADSLLALAQRTDPRWSRPAIDRGWVAHQRANLLRGRPRIVLLQAGLPYAEDALRRAPQSAEALELRGTLRWAIFNEMGTAGPDLERLRAAETDLRAAVDRDSTRARAWATLSYLLWYRGSSAEAGIAARRALREDAYLADARDVFVQLFYSELTLGRFGQAAEWCRRGRLSFPVDWRFLDCELTLLRHDVTSKPDPDRAWALVKELEGVDPADKASATGRPYFPIYRRVVAAAISARAGRRELARAELARARRATEGDSALRLDLAYDEAYLRLVLGERERAVLLLRGLVDSRPALVPLLARDPLFLGLRITD